MHAHVCIDTYVVTGAKFHGIHALVRNLDTHYSVSTCGWSLIYTSKVDLDMSTSNPTLSPFFTRVRPYALASPMCMYVCLSACVCVMNACAITLSSFSTQVWPYALTSPICMHVCMHVCMYVRKQSLFCNEHTVDRIFSRQLGLSTCCHTSYTYTRT
jgi:hypothetical protein